MEIPLKTSHQQQQLAFSRAVGRQEDLCEPEQVEELDGVVAVAAGGNYSLALTEDGHVWSWGSGTVLGRENSKAVRVGRVEELSKVVSISGGETHAGAVTEDGQVWVWGAAKGWGGKGEVIQPEVLERTGEVVQASCSVGRGHHPHTLLLCIDGTVSIFNVRI